MKTKIHETLYNYCKDADVSHYKTSVPNSQMSYQQEQDAKNLGSFAFAFKPVCDSDFSVDMHDFIEKNGKTYVWVNWGENETSYIPDSEVERYLWLIYEIDGAGDAEAWSQVFDSEESANEQIFISKIMEYEKPADKPSLENLATVILMEEPGFSSCFSERDLVEFIFDNFEKIWGR